MKARSWLIVGMVLIAAGGVAGWVLSNRTPEWTTSSPQALAELQHGLEMQSKYYHAEARAYFEKAVALDPSFTIAKYFLFGSSKSLPDFSSEERKRLASELLAASVDGLTARERYLIQITQAQLKRDFKTSDRLMAEFLNALPSDPYAIQGVGSVAVNRQQWDEAESLFRRLIEVAPNQVTSYNELGYLAMARGRFAESEKMFQTYRYLAPDQANPHDSLGELYVVTGRFDEAERELAEAIRLKPDFCASYSNLFVIAIYQGDVAKAEDVIVRVEHAGACGEAALTGLRCELKLSRALLKHDWEGAWNSAEGACAKANGESLDRFYAALLTGRTADAKAFEDGYRKAVEWEGSGGRTPRVPAAFLAHIQGAEALNAGHFSEAITLLRDADGRLSYRTRYEAMPKLVNRLLLVRALRGSGDSAAADQLLADVRGVNPRFVELVSPLVGLSG